MNRISAALYKTGVLLSLTMTEDGQKYPYLDHTNRGLKLPPTAKIATPHLSSRNRGKKLDTESLPVIFNKIYLQQNPQPKYIYYIFTYI